MCYRALVKYLDSLGNFVLILKKKECDKHEKGRELLNRKNENPFSSDFFSTTRNVI